MAKQMNFYSKTFVIPLLILIGFGCNSPKQLAFKPTELYRSKELIIVQVAKDAFVHTSFLQTNDFGNVPCNGVIVKNGNEALVFDTPTNDKSSEELIKWIKENLHCNINAIVPTHFHNDCLGGLPVFEAANIPSYANNTTIALAKTNKSAVPQNGFHDSLRLQLGNETVIVQFFGEGHTKDNVVGYFPKEELLFGGCLIKELNAGKGFLGDANVAAWPATVEKIKQQYPHLKIVVPGHGDYGNRQLLDYTINLFKVK